MKLFKAALAIVLLAFLVGCSLRNPAHRADEKLQYFEYGNVSTLAQFDAAQLAKSDLEKGVTRFVGVAGFSIVVPEIDTDKCAAHSNFVYLIRGTSDMTNDVTHQERALEFASRYNEVIKNHLVARGKLDSYLDCGK